MTAEDELLAGFFLLCLVPLGFGSWHIRQSRYLMHPDRLDELEQGRSHVRRAMAWYLVAAAMIVGGLILAANSL